MASDFLRLLQHPTRGPDELKDVAGSTIPPPPALTDERLILRDRQTGRPIPNLRYVAFFDDGRQFDGVTDEHGWTALIESDKEETLYFVFFQDDEPA